MMECTRAAERLDDYVDGGLAEPEAREVRDHLASCEVCAHDEAELRTLLRRAGELPTELEPRRDLWPGIRDRVAAKPVSQARAGGSAAPYWLAAAAAALVVLSSAVTLWVVRHGAPPASGVARPAPELVALRTSEPDYIQARKALYTALQQRRAHLSPETVKVIDQNLAVMDQALRTMKSALEKDPGNRGLAVLIESTYRQEIQLLMQASSLPTNA